MTRTLIVCLLSCSAYCALPPQLFAAKDVKPFDYDRHGGKEHCLKSDFDGNGVSDYVAPMGEGWVHVFMNYGTKAEKVIDIDAGGVAELYMPRKEVGKHGEPIVKNPSILVRWVGRTHVVFTWSGSEFKKLSYPGFDEPR